MAKSLTPIKIGELVQMVKNSVMPHDISIYIELNDFVHKTNKAADLVQAYVLDEDDNLGVIVDTYDYVYKHEPEYMIWNFGKKRPWWTSGKGYRLIVKANHHD